MARTRLTLCLAALLGGAAALAVRPPSPAAPAPEEPGPAVANTFSIVAYDPERKEWGVGVASKYLAVGSAVPFAKAGVGAAATQAYVNVTLGSAALERMAKGKSAEEALKVVDDDKNKEHRQLGLVDAKGEAATFTGKRCVAWAGGKTGKHYAVQGNILKGKEVIDAMAKAFEADPKRALAWRLMDALEAGEKAGGDKRGKQSAALLVVRDGRGPNGFGDRYIDLRVDDHKDPVPELGRLLRLRRDVKP